VDEGLRGSVGPGPIGVGPRCHGRKKKTVALDMEKQGKVCEQAQAKKYRSQKKWSFMSDDRKGF